MICLTFNTATDVGFCGAQMTFGTVRGVFAFAVLGEVDSVSDQAQVIDVAAWVIHANVVAFKSFRYWPAFLLPDVAMGEDALIREVYLHIAQALGRLARDMASCHSRRVEYLVTNDMWD